MKVGVIEMFREDNLPSGIVSRKFTLLRIVWFSKTLAELFQPESSKIKITFQKMETLTINYFSPVINISGHVFSKKYI
mgnify:CR=1 FL=1